MAFFSLLALNFLFINPVWFSNVCVVWFGHCHPSVGNVYAWGENFYGKCGVFSLGFVCHEQALWLQNLKMLNFFLQNLIFSKKYLGQLGLGHFNTVTSPTMIRSLIGLSVKQIAAGSAHSVFLTKSGAVFCSGKNDFGQLGLGDTKNREWNSPRSIDQSIDWLIDWLIDRLIDWLIDWLIDQSIDQLIDGLIDWLIDQSIDQLIDGLIDWLIDWLIGSMLETFLLPIWRGGVFLLLHFQANISRRWKRWSSSGWATCAAARSIRWRSRWTAVCSRLARPAVDSWAMDRAPAISCPRGRSLNWWAIPFRRSVLVAFTPWYGFFSKATLGELRITGCLLNVRRTLKLGQRNVCARMVSE